MSEISIKVNIGGRSYPLTIGESEENVIRHAEQSIETSIQSFQKNYAVKDKQDLLAMAALQVAAAAMAKGNKPAPPPVQAPPKPPAPDFSPQLSELEQLVDSYLA